MKKSFAIIGLGRFGMGVVKTLSKSKCEIIAIDVDNNCVTEAARFVEHCVVTDATNVNNLRQLGVGHVDHAVVAIGNNLQATILATINLKELGVKRVTVRVDTPAHITVLERLGADEIIVPEEASAISLANHIISDNILDYYKVQGDFAVVKIKVKDGRTPKTLIDLNSRNKFDVSIVGIVRDNNFFLPKGSDMVQGKDIVLVIGKNNNVLKFEEFLNA